MKKVITDDFVIVYEIAKAINFWLYEKGDKTDQYINRLDLEHDIQEVVIKALEKGRKQIEKFKDRLNGNTPKWTAKVLLDEGYGRQCLVLEPFEAETKEEAQRMGQEKVTALFAGKPNAEIFEVKIQRLRNG